jgi:hypothetical protein
MATVEEPFPTVTENPKPAARQFRDVGSLEEGHDTVGRYQQPFTKVTPELAPQAELSGLGGWLAVLASAWLWGLSNRF